MHIDTHFFWVPRCKITRTQYLLSFMPELPGRTITSTVATPSPSTFPHSSSFASALAPLPVKVSLLKPSVKNPALWSSCTWPTVTMAVDADCFSMSCVPHFLQVSCCLHFLLASCCLSLTPPFLHSAGVPLTVVLLGVSRTGNFSLAVSNWQLIQDWLSLAWCHSV